MLLHLEPNGGTNTAEYVNNIVSNISSNFDKKVATSRNSSHGKHELSLFGEYGNTNNKVLKAFYYLIGWFKLIHYIFSKKDTVILHYHWLKLSPIDFFFLKIVQFRSNIRIVGTVHNYLPHESNGFDKLFFPKIYRVSDRLIVHTKSTREKLVKLGIPEGKCEVIPHYSYPVPKLHVNSPPAKNSILFFGVIRDYKGLDILIEALRIIGDRYEWALDVVGKQEMDLSDIKSKIEAYGLEKHVNFKTGWVKSDSIPEIFQNHEIVVLPYKAIDNSGLLHLAMSYGKKIVASRLGSLKDIIEHGKTGLLFEPNDPVDLASKLELLISKRDDYATMGKNAQKYMKDNHSIEEIAKRHISLYQEFYS